MRHYKVLSLHRVGVLGWSIIGLVIFACLIMAAVGLIVGPLAISVVALILLLVVLVTGPFVLSGRWRKPAPVATRRPVVRRRRA